MLDTDTCSYVLRQRPVGVLKTMQAKVASKARLVISSVTYAELRLGAARSNAARKHNRLIDAFCERLNAILAWDVDAADQFAQLQSSLLTVGTPIGVNDAMIAGHALSSGATLVSNNSRHFRQVPKLVLDNWVEV